MDITGFDAYFPLFCLSLNIYCLINIQYFKINRMILMHTELLLCILL
jgi:hypothetical protein